MAVTKVRSSKEATRDSITELRKVAKEKYNDSENYHCAFDDILERRLEELDPDFMEAMNNEYYKSDMCRWYA